MHAEGSANLDGAQASGSADYEGADDVEQGGESSGQSASLAGDDSLALAAGEPPLLGARHDLTLMKERATNKCQCLSVALGPANLPAFRWKGGPPALDEQTQLVVALSSEGEGCKEPKDSLGASYWGYRVRGNDVFVFVESSGGGRPLTSGAIIPKPFADGNVYVAPASKRTPYGRAADGKASECRLGNPGVQRVTPVEDH